VSTNSVPATRAIGSTGAQRWRLALIVVLVLAAIAVLATAGLNQTLIYYRTPTELVDDRGLVGRHVRVGGLVAPNSLRRTGHTVRFTLTDGATDLPVKFTGAVNGVFAPGRNALVDGRLTPGGTFDGNELMVKHDDSYGGPSGRPYMPRPVGRTP
jgi:cytochrome c-type biogenesis protein CcmE